MTAFVPTLAIACVALVLLMQAYFGYVEVFKWNTPRLNKVFGVSEADQPHVAWATALALNQGVYNWFLAAGLAWSLLAPTAFKWQLALFFCGCVLVAGIVGGLTVTKRILYLQGGIGLLGTLAAAHQLFCQTQ